MDDTGEAGNSAGSGESDNSEWHEVPMRIATLFAGLSLATAGCFGSHKSWVCAPSDSNGDSPPASAGRPAETEGGNPRDVRCTAPRPKIIINVPEATTVTAPTCAAPTGNAPCAAAPAAPAMVHAPAAPMMM